jgi:hypothetical protein
MDRLLGSLIVFFLATGPGWTAEDPPEEAKEKAALLQARSLASACEAYAANPGNPKPAQHPQKLADLVAPPFVKAGFLKNGKADLFDPWGQEFKYEVVEVKDGVKLPYVWTERTVGGKTTVYGQKPPEKKK